MREIVIEERDAKQRLDKFLRRCLPAAGSGFLYKMLRKKNIVLNGKKATGNERLSENDVVTLFFSDETLAKFTGASNVSYTDDIYTNAKNPSDTFANAKRPRDAAGENDAVTGRAAAYRKAYRTLPHMEIVYEDEDILILNKPAGVLSQKAAAGDSSANEWFLGYLLFTYGTDVSHETNAPYMFRGFVPSVCNRLDRNTSGLLLCGKTLAGSRFLSALLKERTLEKYYVCIARGKLEGAFTLHSLLEKDETKNIVRETTGVKASARLAETEFTPLAYFEEGVGGRDCTALYARLLTGKTHQIRAQLSGAGHPIAGDPKYGDLSWNTRLKKEGIGRQLLHAYSVVFPKHTEEERFAHLSGRSFHAAPPEDMARFFPDTLSACPIV